MRVRSAIGAALLTGLLATVSCQETRVAPEDLRVALDSLEHKLGVVDYRVALESWCHEDHRYSPLWLIK